MAEITEFAIDAWRKATRSEMGAGTHSLRFGVFAYSPEWEARIRSFPDLPGMPKAQNADGSFLFVADIDLVDAAAIE